MTPHPPPPRQPARLVIAGRRETSLPLAASLRGWSALLFSSTQTRAGLTVLLHVLPLPRVASGVAASFTRWSPSSRGS